MLRKRLGRRMRNKLKYLIILLLPFAAMGQAGCSKELDALKKQVDAKEKECKEENFDIKKRVKYLKEHKKIDDQFQKEKKKLDEKYQKKFKKLKEKYNIKE